MAGHRYWRIHTITAPGDTLDLSQIVLYDINQSPYAVAAVTATVAGAGDGVAALTDGDLTTHHLWQNADAPALVLEFDLGAANEGAEVRYVAQGRAGSAGQTMTAFTLACSPDGVHWMDWRDDLNGIPDPVLNNSLGDLINTQPNHFWGISGQLTLKSEPLAATVRAYDAETGQLTAETHSGSDGFYLFNDLPYGLYHVLYDAGAGVEPRAHGPMAPEAWRDQVIVCVDETVLVGNGGWGGKINASSYYSAYYPWQKAFDGATSGDPWRTATNNFSPDGYALGDVWWQLDLTFPRLVTGLEMWGKSSPPRDVDVYVSDTGAFSGEESLVGELRDVFTDHNADIATSGLLALGSPQDGRYVRLMFRRVVAGASTNDMQLYELAFRICREQQAL
jgi:hypothetical protein